MVVIGLVVFKKSPLEIVLKKSCMPETKSTNDLEAIYSYVKNMKGAN
jgi:hypothetical protein